MKKKLGIALREPVKIYAPTNSDEDPSEIDAQEANAHPNEASPKNLKKALSHSSEAVGREEIKTEIAATNDDSNLQTIKKEKLEQSFDIKNKNIIWQFAGKKKNREQLDPIEAMSERTFEIWKYIANLSIQTGNKIKSDITVTRAEVMREAKIGSTNTYRLAIQKLQELNLITVELRPGVTAGSVFHLTEKGIDLIKNSLAQEQNF